MRVLQSFEFFVAARVLLSSVFVGLAVESLLRLTGMLGNGSVPASAGALTLTAFELVTGVMILFGWQVRRVALILALFLLVDAFVSHQFWRLTGAEQHGQLLHFLKN